MFEAVYERLILLLAGASLEAATTALAAEAGEAVTEDSEGFATGATASRRARGDRIELWLSGPKPRTPPPGEWLERLKGVLADELEMPEVSRERAGEVHREVVRRGADRTACCSVQLKTTKYKKHHGK